MPCPGPLKEFNLSACDDIRLATSPQHHLQVARIWSLSRATSQRNYNGCFFGSPAIRG